MSSLEVILLVVVIFLAAGVLWLLVARRRSQHLRSRFGPEYHRTVTELGDRRKAERDLERREKHVQRLHIRPLDPSDRDLFVKAWQEDQSRFVDDPEGAVVEADRLVTEVMGKRGYPVSDFEQRVDDVSVDHPHLVENYRTARDIVLRHKQGKADTEDLRRALVCYRALFDELLEAQEVRR